MQKALLIAFTLIILPFQIWAQNTLSGIVRDNHHEPLAFATVQLSVAGIATASDANGHFSLKNIPDGIYQLKISAVGFTTIERQVEIDNNLDLGVLTMEESVSELDQVVVTASRLEQTLGDVPIPVSVISQEQIRKSGNIRLDEILTEQTGLVLNSDHGTGIQIQGLNSEYIKILVDGEPLIGRTAGTLDLSRVTVNNIDRVEIVKGPSSSLYGSEAMGGVINIITRNPQSGLSLNLGARYRRFNTQDLNATLSYGSERWKISAFHNRLSSDGYDLQESTVGQTVAAYTASTSQLKMKYKVSDQLQFSLSGRYYEEPQEDQTIVAISDGQNTTEVLHDYNAKRTDWNLLPKLEWSIGNKAFITLRQYLSEYETSTSITRASDGHLYSLDEFAQDFSRTEAQGDLFLGPEHTLTVGAGHIQESVSSTRYVDSTFTSNYLFAQHQWEATTALDVTIGLRYDNHKAYGDNLSPKLALGYQVNRKLKIKASFGGGFKAPDFRQLLLNYTNPTVGYSVMGTSVVVDGVENLIDQGETFRFDPVNNPNSIESARANAAVAASGLSAESSLSWNLGADYQLNSQVTISGNLFRNHISNLIDTWAIAQKDNGQFVFSYRNVEDIVTQGLELNANYEVSRNLRLSIGYQFLDTFDRSVIDQINEGTLAYRPSGEIVSRRVERSDYGGLFGRSRHSGNLKVSYTHTPWRLGVYFRSIYRGRWGFGDRDGNQVLVGDDEYADGYFQHNLSIEKSLGRNWLVNVGANNLLDTTNEFEAALPGRLWFVGLKFNLNTDKN